MAAATLALAGCGGGGDDPVPPTVATSFSVGKAACSSDDQPETGLQGQIPMADRAAGFKGFHCNVQKVAAVSSSRGEGTFQQFALVHDRAGRTCGYGGGAFQDSLGTTVVDLTDPAKAVETTLLKTPAMLNPGEGLKAHQGRGLLVSAHYVVEPSANEAAHGFDVYDIGTDCRYPQLLASTVQITFSTTDLKQTPVTINGKTSVPWQSTERIYGHEGAFSPDGLTYYIGDVANGVYHAIDIADPTNPNHLSVFQSPGYASGNGFQGLPHSLSVSNDGTRGYFVNEGLDFGAPGGLVPQTGEWHNGFMVVDTSEIQARKPGGQVKFLKEVVIRDGAGQQGTIPVTIDGNKYVIAFGEMGTGQSTRAGTRSACAAGMTPFAMAQLFYIGDEMNPVLINKVQMEANDPKNCNLIEPEVSAVPYGFIYDVHHCSVDNRDNATTLACGYFQSGIRVYDIRDPRNIKEIAYFTPEAKGSTPGWCASMPFLDARTGMLYSSCADTGVVALRFKNGVWPFPESRTPVDKQL